MKKLKEKIVQEGTILNENILKIDSFINNQIDSILMNDIANEFYEVFKSYSPNKIMTVESSGIAPAILVALKFKIPLIIVRKEQSLISDKDVYSSKIQSFTKNKIFAATISKQYLTKNDNVLIIDDFLASGQAILGCLNLINQAKAKNIGVGIIVEKTFQLGRQKLEDLNINVHSLARIKSLKNNKVEFED
ncbi:xanthine phosphoribosyltransferase [Mycoplasma sp. Mirounga ES2805-ORL]|uniref:xanthine phosphoribosyltransferase n=1 Tax=Mycoplasma sp. Mirounga ES2805-ORL TaxID=754514 RepID=UPI00197C3B03|nr:xanthine phosphoribosyltransferase [Mycoplasma sp. Mirounga ES2805-ORL]QSF13814.1 xanthine phosphoribosyltransferase [Mycoplasma sp. Mirounga ES2805-ORL]